MNGFDWKREGVTLAKGVYIKERSEIPQPGRRIVFIDEGRLSPDSWTVYYNQDVYYNQERWWDPVPARHGMGPPFPLRMSMPSTGNGPTLAPLTTRTCVGSKEASGGSSAISNNRDDRFMVGFLLPVTVHLVNMSILSFYG